MLFSMATPLLLLKLLQQLFRGCFMFNDRFLSVGLISSELKACEQAAGATEGRRSYRTWLLSRLLGWHQLRALIPRTTLHRHACILRRAGLSVPDRIPRSSEAPVAFASGGVAYHYWFDALSPFGSVGMVQQQPTLIEQLFNHRFFVARAWASLGVEGASGRQVLEAWPVGTSGVVCSLIFEGRWSVEVEHKDWTLPEEERWPRIPLREFLLRTKPEGGTQ